MDYYRLLNGEAILKYVQRVVVGPLPTFRPSMVLLGQYFSETNRASLLLLLYMIVLRKSCGVLSPRNVQKLRGGGQDYAIFENFS